MDPNQLRAKKAELLAQAKAIQTELTAKDCDLTDEQRAKREARVDELITEAEAREADAKAIEAREADASARRRRIDSLATEGATRTGDLIADAKPADVKVGKPQFVNDKMKGFQTPREFFALVMKHAGRDPRATTDERLRYLAAAGTDEHQTGSDPYGGFLVPEGMSPDLLSVQAEDDPFVGRTQLVPMDTPSININARVDKNHTTSVSGGLTVSRKAETAAAASSRMQLEQINLRAHSVFGFAYATEELLNDSPRSVVALLEAGFRDEFQANHVKELLRGTGVGEPEGVHNSPALIEVAKEGSQTADTIVGANLLKMRARCWRFSQAIWIANHDTYPQLATAHVGGTNGDVFLYEPGRGIDVPDTLLGRPIFYSEYMETLGDKNDIMLIVPSQILEGTLTPLESAESIHVRFDRNERAFRLSQRNDARGWWRAALTPNKGANSLSPFVTLAARA